MEKTPESVPRRVVLGRRADRLGKNDSISARPGPYNAMSSVLLPMQSRRHTGHVSWTTIVRQFEVWASVLVLQLAKAYLALAFMSAWTEKKAQTGRAL